MTYRHSGNFPGERTHRQFYDYAVYKDIYQVTISLLVNFSILGYREAKHGEEKHGGT